MRHNLAPGCVSSDVKLCQRKLLYPLFSGTPFFVFSVFFVFFFLALQRLARLKCNLEPNCKLIILQPHACTQRFRLRILRRTRSFPGRTSARSLSGRIESIWEIPSKNKGGRLPSADERGEELQLSVRRRAAAAGRGLHDRPQHGGPGESAEAAPQGSGPADETGQAGGCEAAGRLPGASEAQDPRLASFAEKNWLN